MFRPILLGPSSGSCAQSGWRHLWCHSHVYINMMRMCLSITSTTTTALGCEEFQQLVYYTECADRKNTPGFVILSSNYCGLWNHFVHLWCVLSRYSTHQYALWCVLYFKYRNAWACENNYSTPAAWVCSRCRVVSVYNAFTVDGMLWLMSCVIGC